MGFKPPTPQMGRALYLYPALSQGIHKHPADLLLEPAGLYLLAVVVRVRGQVAEPWHHQECAA